MRASSVTGWFDRKLTRKKLQRAFKVQTTKALQRNEVPRNRVNTVITASGLSIIKSGFIVLRQP